MDKECINYFKMRKGFDRMFQGLKDKYESLGHLGGKFFIENLTNKEREALQGFLCKDFSNCKSATLSIAQIEKALSGTKFDISLDELVLGYFNGKVYPKRQILDAAAEKRRMYFDHILTRVPHKNVREWLGATLEFKTQPYSIIVRKYDKDRVALKILILNVSKALQYLLDNKGNTIRMPVFSATITDDPHYFDEGSEANTLLTYGLCKFFDAALPSNAEMKTELLYKSGIIKDDISNFTICYGIKGLCADGSPHSGLYEFAKLGEPLNISLANLINIGVAFPCNEENKVYVFENPSVFSSILDARKSFANMKLSMVCTNGQLKLASLILLDKLAEGGAQLIYSGDFDPEGLLIAQRLKARYGQALSFWRYSAWDYLEAVSNKSIAQERIKKLDNIRDLEFLDIINKMRELKLAGYQEKILGHYIDDLKNGCR